MKRSFRPMLAAMIPVAMVTSLLAGAAPATASEPPVFYVFQTAVAAATDPEAGAINRVGYDDDGPFVEDLQWDAGHWRWEHTSVEAGSFTPVKTGRTKYYGYDGTTGYGVIPGSEYTALQRSALTWAGVKAPYQFTWPAVPMGWAQSGASVASDISPLAIAREFSEYSPPITATKEPVTEGARYTLVFDRGAGYVPLTLRFLVSPDGTFLRVEAEADYRYFSELIPAGSGFSIPGVPAMRYLSANDVDGIVASYRAHLATVAKAGVKVQATAVAKRVNRYAKAHHRTVTTALVKKRGKKAVIRGYSITKISRGVKVSRTYLPGSKASRCVVAKRGKAKAVAC